MTPPSATTRVRKRATAAGDGPAGPAAPALETSAATPDSELPKDRFLNRELSWLDFNTRVLELAEDRSAPLLERAKFLAIFATNLDEFYMVRVAGLQRRQELGLRVRSADGLSPRDQLDRIYARTGPLMHRHAQCFTEDVEPALAAEGIKLVAWEDLDEEHRTSLHAYFREQVFPVLTPLAVDPAHPFPFISNLSLNLAVIVRDASSSAERFARVKVPRNVRRLVPIGDGSSFLLVEDLIGAHLNQLFPGMEIVEKQVFRVTRNADFEVEEDRHEDLLQAMERELAQRRFGDAVRLEVTNTMSDHVLQIILEQLAITADKVVRLPFLDTSSLWELQGIDRPDLKDESYVPTTSPAFGQGETPKSVFATLDDSDVLVHLPYESFATSVQRFIEQAAADPQVLAIKQTLYRTSGDSPIVDALIEAAQAGKQVVVLVELKARFDEENNIVWARKLERAGVHVVYGVVGLKTHCKTALVVRQEAGTLRRYCHIGTGNYNPKTARIYEDLGLFTADREVGSDLTDLFNVLTGYSRQTDYRRLLVAPHGIRDGIIGRVEKVIEAAQRGEPARVGIKVNSIVDEKVIDTLYRASQSGVSVDLAVRGICALRPGVAGLSENIRVRSILGRYLEHSRIFMFSGGDWEEFWIGSADIMHRNLDRRVEALVRVTDESLLTRLRELMSLNMADDIAGWDLQPDGGWQRRAGSDAAPLRDLQVHLMAQQEQARGA